jgi:hypothetical protein
LTERKAEGILDINLLFSTTCQDICKRGRHWWRKWDVQFNLVQGTTTYDLTVAGNFTPNLTNIAVEEILGVTLITQASPLQTADLTPIFDRQGIIAMKQNTTQAQPSRYTIDPSTWNVLRIDPPDRAYLTEMTFWAMPNLAKESTSDVVPVIPPFYHDCIVNGMEARVNRRVYGPKDSRYVDSAAAYEACIMNMMMRPQFTPNYSRQWTDDSPGGSGGGGAVQSTSRISP